MPHTTEEQREQDAMRRRSLVSSASNIALEVLKQAAEGSLAYYQMGEDGFPDETKPPTYMPVPVSARISAAKTLADPLAQLLRNAGSARRAAKRNLPLDGWSTGLITMLIE